MRLKAIAGNIGVVVLAMVVSAICSHFAFALSAGEVYNFVSVRSNQFVETWTSVAQGGTIHIRAHVANQRGGLAAGPFLPIVTLSFRDAQGGKMGEIKLYFNALDSQKNQWHEINVLGGFWEQSVKIVATAADNTYARPPIPRSGSWVATDQIGQVAGSLVVIRPQ
jgi:hypothetical protein